MYKYVGKPNYKHGKIPRNFFYAISSNGFGFSNTNELTRWTFKEGVIKDIGAWDHNERERVFFVSKYLNNMLPVRNLTTMPATKTAFDRIITIIRRIRLRHTVIIFSDIKC
jgi:hypothetical protein